VAPVSCQITVYTKFLTPSAAAAPDASTLLKFRRLLKEHKPTESIFNEIKAHLAEKGLFSARWHD